MKPFVRRALWIGGVAILVVAAVVVFYRLPEPEAPTPTQPARKAVAAGPPRLTSHWETKVGRTPEIVSGGSQIALSGRVILTGLADDGEPKGSLTVELYEWKTGEDAEPLLLEKWLFAQEHLPQFGRPEAEGFVLPLNLPWGSYRADIERVKLVARFTPAQGEELTHETTVRLDHSGLQATAP